MASYAFPHTDADERCRLELLEERLDPLTIRRIERLELTPGMRYVETGASGERCHGCVRADGYW
jgi:hypothetical protein